MNKKIKIYQFLLISTLLLVILAGCNTDGSANNSSAKEKEGKASESIRIGYQKGNTLNILRESGVLEEKLKEKDLKVEWKEFNGGGPLLEALFTGNVDFGHASDGAAIFAQAGNKPLVYVGADLPNPEGIGILVHKSSDIKTIEDLKGKRVGAAKGGNHHYLTILALKEAGLDVDDVEWVFLSDAAQGRAAFETEKIDAFATYDPFLAGTEIDLETINLTEGVDYGYPNRTFYFANVDYNKEQPELVDLILEAIGESDQWANDNKPDVVDLVSDALGIDKQVIHRVTERRDYGVSKINEEIIATQQKQADIYFEVGLLPKEVDVSKDMPIK